MTSSTPKPATISPARAAAFEILERVAHTDAHSDDLLHSSRLTELSQQDRNLTTALVLGVLRWQLALDATIRPLLSRPDIELASPVATAIRLGAFQLLHLDRIPPHAALSESVELVRSAGHGHASGMVNAILRKITRAAPPRVPLVETTAALADRLAHPLWLVTRWQKNYGRSAAIAICTYDQTPPAQGTLFAQPDDSSPDNLTTQQNMAAPEIPASQKNMAAPEISAPPQIGYPEPSGSGLIPLEEEGALAPRFALPLMDDGSRLVAELAAASHTSPLRIWDACAAPGGKTLVLAARHPTADILATDVSPRRLKALADRLRPSAPHVRTLAADATHLPEDESAFDLILCDVPCSGTGTLARNPELKSRLQPADLPRQAARQREILSRALLHLAPGGRLLYSTCSLEPEENEQVVLAVLAALPGDSGITQLSLEPALRSLSDAGRLHNPSTPTITLLREGHLRTLPGVTLQGDGFFAALFAKD